MKKALTSVLTAVIFSFVFLEGAGAFGGTYPESIGYVPYNEEVMNSEKYAYTPSSEDHIFTVGDKSFILLDTDGEGNYFVMTQEHYGQHAFENSVESHLVLEEAVETESGYDFVQRGSLISEEWIFDPENPDSIAYWLNNDFYNFGNGGDFVLPDEIKDNIITKTWQIEGFEAYPGSGIRLYDRYYDSLGANGYKGSAEYAKEIFQEPYSVECKIALMSYTEYMEYQNLIGISFGHGAWGGMMLRTQDAFLTTGNEQSHSQLLCYFGPLQVSRRTEGEDPTQLLKICIPDAPAEGYYFVRPVFWLSKDFFKNVKCDIDNIGRYPLGFLSECSIEDLKKLYSDEEIKKIGLVPGDGEIADIQPNAADVGFFGNAADGMTLTGRYEYLKNSDEIHDGLNEFGSKYQWYVSDTAEGEKIPVKNADSMKYTPDSSYIGKYIWFSVTPRNAFSNYGETVFSTEAVKIRPNPGVSVTFKDNEGNEVTSVQCGKHVRLEVVCEENVVGGCIYILKYDNDRQLIYMQSESLGNGIREYPIGEIVPGETLKVMILKDTGTLSPYCIYEIK